MFEKHDAIMLLTDPSAGLIVDANPAAARFYQCPRERLQSMQFRDLGLDLPASVTSAPPPGQIAEWERFDTTTRLPDGSERHVELHSSVISVLGRRLVFSIMHNVTEQKRLQKQIVEAAEAERQRIGRDLHDSLGGHLTGVALMSKALAQTLADKGSAEAPVAEQIVSTIVEGLALARAIAHGLCPVGAGEFGLIRGLHELALNVRRHTGVACRVHASQRIRVDDPVVASHLFRIVEEAVQNALRHARARNIRIRLTRVRDGLALRVWNDGKPLPKEIDASKGIGLRIMRYRADMLGTHLELERVPGGGTAVSCLLPDRRTGGRKTRRRKQVG
jgi:PAS domain S-box-containing protein